MLFVDNRNITRPDLNLALEEHLVRTADTPEDILLFYINEPSIIIGRNQNTFEEINLDYVQANQVHVVRRLSGGGTVYHDLGNLNFSFITPHKSENVSNFKKFTEPVIAGLQAMGVPAELRGRNDIVVADRKISGNAQYIAAQRMVSHGTLLFDSDLSQVVAALNVKASKFISKGIKSVRSRVANISEFLPAPVDTPTFRARLLDSLFAGAAEIPQYELTPADWEAVERLAAERYRSWEWNYGRSPDFNVQRTQRFPSGEIDARIDVQGGVIQSVHFYGDFFGQGEVAELAQRLAGVRYAPPDLAAALDGVDIGYYFSGITLQEFLQFIY